jgi:hypothetical protein
MAQIVQVEIKSGTTHTVTWLASALKPKPGMVVVCKGDPRQWSVVHAYATTLEASDSNIDWKAVGCESNASGDESEPVVTTGEPVESSVLQEAEEEEIPFPWI